MGGAVNLLIDVDHVGERIGADVSQSRIPNSRPMGWVHFDGFALYGTDPVAFRRFAERCLTAAGLLESAPPAAESPKNFGIL